VSIYNTPIDDYDNGEDSSDTINSMQPFEMKNTRQTNADRQNVTSAQLSLVQNQLRSTQIEQGNKTRQMQNDVSPNQ
jgi:hypothetical protein